MVDLNKKMVMRRDADRIGALPDSLLHHILSFLDMKEVVWTSLVSTRWKNLWVSVPVLNFDHTLWKKKSRNKKCNRQLKSKFMNFVDRVLFLHDGSKVTKFNLSCSSYCNIDRFGAWMTLAVRKQFQEIHIDVEAFNAGESTSRELPSAIFCPAITVFKFKYSKLQMPNSIFLLPHLKTLILHYIELPQGNSNGELVLTCPVLENLELVDCAISHLNVLNISSPQLKNLDIHHYPEHLEACQMKLCTPNLESLWLRGLRFNNYSLGSLSYLVNAQIELFGKPPTAQCLIQIFESISCATTIKVWGWREVPADDIYDMANISFSNLRSLKLGEHVMVCPCTILNLFKSSPCLETLALIGYNMKYYREDLYHLNFSHLKSLTIGSFDCYKYELTFLDFLLKNAVVLEKLTVLLRYRKGKFIDKIYSLVNASSSRVVLSVR